jgi:hypothetical protein
LNATEENIGYCLMQDVTMIRGENFKISAGEEKSTAETCALYHREIPTLRQAEFLNWRSSIIVQKIQNDLSKYQNELTKHQNKFTNIVMWLTIVLTILTFIQVYQLSSNE